MYYNSLFLSIGILGVVVIALAFYLEATNKLSKDHKAFSWYNLFGNFCLFLYALFNQVWLFVFLDLFLIIVGMFGLYGVYKKRYRNSSGFYL